MSTVRGGISHADLLNYAMANTYGKHQLSLIRMKEVFVAEEIGNRGHLGLPRAALLYLQG
jgi:hypothetical protein